MEGSKPKEVEVERRVGRSNLQWLKKSGLNEEYYPVEFVKIKSMFGKWTTHTNLRAFLANMWQPGSLHPNVTPFVAE